MKSLGSWLLTIFVVMFWGFRVVMAVVESVGGTPVFPISNVTFEVVLLFTTLPLIILIVKRVAFGGLLYFGSYAAYFGYDLVKYAIQLFKGEALGVEAYSALFIDVIAIAISFLVLADLVFNKYRGNKLGDKKTDWFFKNSDYDRKFDERADRNEYKMR